MNSCTRNAVSAAYHDRPLGIGYGQTISQPFIVAYMTEALHLKGTEKVLEIGTGSGYQAAVLAETAQEVYSIEIIPELYKSAKSRLSRLGYKTIHLKNDDGYYGWEEHAPYDGIVVTCAAGHIPQPLIRQLKTGGRMIIPVGHPWSVQDLVIVTKDNNGKVKTKNVMPVRFVPLVREKE
jgi:protein-L-isoaspartate(D-aspartate) O-methyltransferase